MRNVCLFSVLLVGFVAISPVGSGQDSVAVSLPMPPAATGTRTTFAENPNLPPEKPILSDERGGVTLGSGGFILPNLPPGASVNTPSIPTLAPPSSGPLVTPSGTLPPPPILAAPSALPPVPGMPALPPAPGFADSTSGAFPGSKPAVAPVMPPFLPFLVIDKQKAPRFMDPRTKEGVKNLFRSIAAVRGLLADPQNDMVLRKILDLPFQTTNLLRLSRFPVLPRFQSRPDENVVRNRSFESYDYRQYGSFQTKLDGTIRTSSLEINLDFLFKGPGKTQVKLKGNLKKEGPLTGGFLMEGIDGYGRSWNLKSEFREILLRDDGFPCGGQMQIAGWDPNQATMVLAVPFPVEDQPNPPKVGKIHWNPSPVKKVKRF